MSETQTAATPATPATPPTLDLIAALDAATKRIDALETKYAPLAALVGLDGTAAELREKIDGIDATVQGLVGAHTIGSAAIDAHDDTLTAHQGTLLGIVKLLGRFFPHETLPDPTQPADPPPAEPVALLPAPAVRRTS